MMRFDTKVVYKLKGERNVSARKSLVYASKLFVIFTYDKKGFTESRLQCLDATSLRLVWEYVHSHVLNNIVLSEANMILCSGMDGTVISFAPDSGEIAWTFRTDESNTGAISNVYNQRAVVSGIQAGSRSTWCLDTVSGQVIWHIPNAGHAYTSLLAGNSVFFCIGHNIYSVALEDGISQWEAHEPDTYLFNPKQVSDFIVVGGHGKFNLYDYKNGDLKASMETGTQAAIREVLPDGDNTLFFGDAAGYFYCYSLYDEKSLFGKEGTVALRFWRYRAKGGISSSPAIMGDRLYFLSDDHKLISLNKYSGTLRWDFYTKGKANISGVTVVGENLYAACGNGYVYRLIE